MSDYLPDSRFPLFPRRTAPTSLDAVKKLDVSGQSKLILDALQSGPLTLQEIAAALEKVPSSCTAALNSLRRKGVVVAAGKVRNQVTNNLCQRWRIRRG